MPINRPQLLPRHLRGKTAPSEPLRLPLRACLDCWRLFHPKSSDRQYCSVACARTALNRQRIHQREHQREHGLVVQRSCVVCGTQFEALQKTKQRTCSLECSRKDPARLLMQRNCVVCGTQFEAGPYKKTCSPKCLLQRFKSQHPPKPPPPSPPLRRCVVCGALFWSRHRQKLTCSFDCSERWHASSRRMPDGRNAPSRTLSLLNCVICNGKFRAHGRTLTCSAKCRKQQRHHARAARLDLQRMALQEVRARGIQKR